MNKHLMAVPFVLAALMILAGCVRAKFPNYYALDVPPPPDPPAKEGVHASLAVRATDVSVARCAPRRQHMPCATSFALVRR